MKEFLNTHTHKENLKKKIISKKKIRILNSSFNHCVLWGHHTETSHT